MEWEFSAEQVVKGEVGYALEDFRRDLACEVRMNTADADDEACAATYNLVYDLTHWLATGKEFDAFLASCAYDPPTCDFLRDVRPMLSPNVAMLGAILQRMIMDGVEAGLPLEDALAQAAADHRRIVGGAMPPVAPAPMS
jgi:hypothetical protein